MMFSPRVYDGDMRSLCIEDYCLLGNYILIDLLKESLGQLPFMGGHDASM